MLGVSNFDAMNIYPAQWSEAGLIGYAVFPWYEHWDGVVVLYNAVGVRVLGGGRGVGRGCERAAAAFRRPHAIAATLLESGLTAVHSLAGTKPRTPFTAAL